jgi:hypothetical protein
MSKKNRIEENLRKFMDLFTQEDTEVTLDLR